MIREHHGAFNRVLQLAHIAFPPPCAERLQAGVADGRRGARAAAAALRGEGAPLVGQKVDQRWPVGASVEPK